MWSWVLRRRVSRASVSRDGGQSYRVPLGLASHRVTILYPCIVTRQVLVLGREKMLLFNIQNIDDQLTDGSIDRYIEHRHI